MFVGKPRINYISKKKKRKKVKHQADIMLNKAYAGCPAAWLLK